MILKHKLWIKLIFLKEIHSKDIFNFGWDFFFNNFNNTVRAPLITYPLLCSTCVTYGTSCHARSQRDFPPFSLSGVFYLALLSAVFKASLGADSSISKLAGLYADLQNITLARLFAWITAIHKRFILVGSI